MAKLTAGNDKIYIATSDVFLHCTVYTYKYYWASLRCFVGPRNFSRYKQMELGVFMYAIIALAVTFMFYTAFLMFGLKPKEPEKKKEEWEEEEEEEKREFCRDRLFVIQSVTIPGYVYKTPWLCSFFRILEAIKLSGQISSLEALVRSLA